MRWLGIPIPRDADVGAHALAGAVLEVLAGDLIAGWVAQLKGAEAAKFGDVEHQAREVRALVVELRKEGDERRRRMLVDTRGDVAAVALAERRRLADLVRPDDISEADARETVGVACFEGPERERLAVLPGPAFMVVVASRDGERALWISAEDEDQVRADLAERMQALKAREAARRQ